MELNLIKLIFASFVAVIVVIGSLINWFEKYLPVILPQTFRYGKFAYQGKPSKLWVIEVPKSWFKHFYVFASVYSLYALYLAIDVYMYGGKPPAWFVSYLDFFCGSNRKTEANRFSVLVVLTLMTLQSFRRGYETWFVSVFSDVKINITQYIVGYTHYWGTITTILAEAEGFKKSRTFIPESDTSFSYVQIFAVILFIYAWINQYQAGKTLANLRKNRSGAVVTKEHKIPRGGLFEYVSSPHMTCEMLMYIALSFILFNNYTFKYILFWVVSNQLESSLLSHWWYLNTFKNYPKNRKAIIPFVL
ncbi:UNVERIFIED_CONTAM: hypothetical protein PYX00_010200 [Menopon gallinae]|uniref:Polyprenal reductase n=1 Tax=Menopon gallinae TaxID=328185 RepID=A0AAW2HEM8_9NEOP